MADDEGARHVARTLRTLELLAVAPRSQSELARELEVHPRTVRRLLARLEEEGFARRVSGARSEYVATLKIVTLAGHVLEGADFVRTARPFVTRLQVDTGEATFLAVPAEDAAMHILHEPARSDVSVRSRLGEKVPYHASAFGKALLAHLPDQIERLITRPLDRLTDRTLIEPAELLLQLAEIRRQGWADDDREYTADVRSVAAPVFDHSRRVIAALGVSAPAHRLPDEQRETASASVTQASAALSESLGFITGQIERPVVF
jgi:IclR family acetate operon transcriptional repressor